MSSPTFLWDAVVPARGSVLLYGRDATLLRTRLWILEGAAFEVWAVTRLLEVDQILSTQRIDLLILCYTLSAKQCEDAVAKARMLQPKTQTMILTEISSVYLKGQHDAVVNALGNPDMLIAAAKRMINPAASSEHPALRVSPSERATGKLHQ